MSHPRKKLNQVSTWKCCASDTMDEIVDELDGGILIRFDGRITVNNRRGGRYRSAAKMLVPFGGFGKPVATQKDSLRHVPLVEPRNRAFCESLIGSLTHPMPTGEFKGGVLTLKRKERRLTVHRKGKMRNQDPQS